MDLTGALGEVLHVATHDGTTPGAAVEVWQGGGPLASVHAGRLSVGGPPVGPGTAWDLASVTKPLVGGLLAGVLREAGELDVDRPLPGLDGVTPRHLLQHVAGYAPWAPLYATEDPSAWGSVAARERLLRAARDAPRLGSPGAVHRYSDVGFLTLCGLLEGLTGDRIDALWARRVPASASWGLSWGAAGPDVAATECCPVRGRVLVGEVHDLNAAALGGVSTHAGLFGSARALATAGQACLEGWSGRGPLGQAGLRRSWAERGAGSHTLGWDTWSGPTSTAGPNAPIDLVGHLGFTGTSLWISPHQQVVVALCTNRVHPTADAPPAPALGIRALRVAVHEAVWRGLA